MGGGSGQQVFDAVLFEDFEVAWAFPNRVSSINADDIRWSKEVILTLIHGEEVYAREERR